MSNEILDPIKKLRFLVKVGNVEHLEELRRGQLYFNQIRYFKELKKDGQRGDAFEGAIGCFRPNRMSLHIIDDQTGEASPIFNFNSFYLHNQDLLSRHIFCSYAYSDPEFPGRCIHTEEFRRTLKSPEPFDLRSTALGNHVLVIEHVRPFFESVDRAINAAGFSGTRAPVRFFNEASYHGDFPVEHLGFLKPLSFSHQREYRFLIHGMPSGPQKLFVGDLSDISRLTTVDDFNEAMGGHSRSAC